MTDRIGAGTALLALYQPDARGAPRSPWRADR